MPCRKTYRSLVLLILLSCISSVSLAQQFEWVNKTFRISRITEQTTRDSAIVFLSATAASGIEAGSSGPVYTLSAKNRYNAEIGNGFVISTGEAGTYIHVVSNRKALADSFYMVKEGDLITLSVKVPVKSYRSVFFELEKLGVTLYKKNDYPLYDFEQLLKKDDKKNTDSLIAICIKELREEAERLSKVNELNEVYTKKAEDGRYKGKSILDVLKNATTKDVLPPLQYVKETPADYRGKSYLFSYLATLWVYAKGPYSSAEMLDTLLSLKPQSRRFIEVVNQNSQAMISDGFVESWAFKAMEEETAGRHRSADSILNVTYPVARMLNDPYSLGLHFLAAAQVNQYREKYQDAIKYCDSGLVYISPKTDGHFYIELMVKKGFCFSTIKRLNESIECFDKAIAVVKEGSFDPNTGSVNPFLGKLYNYKGSTYKQSDDYKKAAESYRLSIEWYKKDSSYRALTNTASVQSELADIYKGQGAYAEALSINEELNETYTKLNDVKARATNHNSLAYVQFKQGKYQDAIKNYRNAERVFTALKFYSNAALSLSNIGQAYWNLGNYDSAIIAHNLSIENGKLAKDLSRQAYSWSQLGSLYNLTGEKNKALSAYDSSLNYYEAAADSAGLLTNLYDVGNVYEKDKQYQKAFSYYNKAHQINLRKGDKSELVNSYFRIAYASDKYDTALARRNYKACYDLAKQIGDLSNTLYAALNLGLLATRQYQYDIAGAYFNEGLELALNQKSKADEAWVYMRMADAESQKLDYDKAIEIYNKALHIYDSLGERSQIPNIYSNIGYAMECKGDFTGSLVYFEKMKTLGSELKNNADIAGALNSMSFVYSIFGEHKKAVECADSALQIFKSLNNNWQIANTYGKLGSVYSGMGEYEKAVRYHMLSDSLYKVEKDDVSRSTAQNNIGVVYFFQSDYDKALDHFLESDRLTKVMNTVNESVLVTRINIGEIYLTKKNFPLAAKYLADANKLSREKKVMRMLGVSSLLLGKLAFENNRIDEALKYFKQAKEACKLTNESDRIVETDIFLGKAYDQLKQDLAASHFHSSIQLGKRISSKYLWQAYYELGIYHYNKEQYDSAAVYFKEAVAEIEETATKLFGGAEAKKLYAADTRKVDLYNKLVASLAKLKKTEEALYYADKSNSQAIKEKLEQSGIVTSDKEKSEALKKGSELLQKQTSIEQTLAKEKAKPEKERNEQLIASLESVRKVAQEDYLNYIDELVTKYPDLQSYFSKTNPKDFRNYIEYIPDSTLVVLYVINDDQLYIFTVSNQETSIKTITLKDDINKHAMRLLGIIKNPENATGTGAIQVRATIKAKDGIKGDFRTESALLYNLLITPIEDQLKGKSTLCIIPNAALCRIPFATLGLPDENNRFRFILEDYNIFYTNKMDIFSRPFRKGNISNSFVAFGNPDRSLPGASLEVNNIKDLFPNATIYLEDDATEAKGKTALKATKFVHFATHGILDNENFSQSHLLMNKDDANDGKLTLAEINGLIKDQTDMIFLSACDMAIPKDLGKGWDVSVLNALLSNRVNTAAAGSWQVPDAVTTILLTEFYKNIKTMSRSEALRRAQATISQDPKYAHPFFWAAFVMYGEWR